MANLALFLLRRKHEAVVECLVDQMSGLRLVRHQVRLVRVRVLLDRIECVFMERNHGLGRRF